ncbi:putative Cytosine deaminase FCY1 [Hirsutella rhossiliensis]|uniref:Cytosine deaminase FCY1 n=1 Tax=Hirsutella rhossiliensis TaxID=111463 RepID=A0A9P8SKR1_9HYPO|nr:putative Cytosine deaminase FCY1 [Hirsutella rhossiliensis]KAH0965494.1 putative Cytosine deaminase FCY1 [Hirsutella rhossiliensis]
MELLAAALTAALADEVHDADEETFLLYAQPATSRDLGFVDPRVPSLSVAVAGRLVTVHQSPAVLASSRPGGTTGAVLWKVTPQLASWLAAPQNPLLALVLPPSASSILELGCGISPLNALALRPRVAHYVLSDQVYVQKLLVQNLAEALDDAAPGPPKTATPRRRARTTRKKAPAPVAAAVCCFRPLDWETDAVTPALAAPRRSFDAVLSCDCVFNEALVAPFVQTCVDVCGLRRRRRRRGRGAAADADSDGNGALDDGNGNGGAPCVCIVAQQLRSDDVFRAWLAAFHAAFRVWRVPPDMLPPELRPSAGFAIHVGILRDDDDE